MVGIFDLPWNAAAITVLVDDCYSSASTSDLRPEAVEGFVTKSIDAARYLEPDEARRHPEASLCGRGLAVLAGRSLARRNGANIIAGLSLASAPAVVHRARQKHQVELWHIWPLRLRP